MKELKYLEDLNLSSNMLSTASTLINPAILMKMPGGDFGECAADHVRITFAADDDTLRKGLERITEFTGSLR